MELLLLSCSVVLVLFPFIFVFVKSVFTFMGAPVWFLGIGDRNRTCNFGGATTSHSLNTQEHRQRPPTQRVQEMDEGDKNSLKESGGKGLIQAQMPSRTGRAGFDTEGKFKARPGTAIRGDGFAETDSGFLMETKIGCPLNGTKICMVASSFVRSFVSFFLSSPCLYCVLVAGQHHWGVSR